MTNELIVCIVCGKPFKSGDFLQAFLRSPDDPVGSWGPVVEAGDQFQTRAAINCDKVRRRHAKNL